MMQTKEHESNDDFEDVIFGEYFCRSVIRIPNQQFMISSAKSKDELFKLGEDGDYADECISAMWFAWKLAHKRYA